MKKATFKEYEAAKAEIIGGVEYREHSELGEDNVIRKTYSTKENGTFYEVNDGGRIEFWSDKHPESRVYDENERETAPRHYGNDLADKIRAEHTGRNELSNFEKFVVDCGYKYETEEELKAAYDRTWKASHDILINREEFIAEAGNHYAETAGETYEALASLYREKKIGPADVYQYAVYHWCLANPDAIVAYQESRDKWIVNDCDTEITKDTARVKVCEEWGFEASCVRIIGTPYYDATDWQFIRFDCARMTWLWKNGSLYQVYE